MYTLIYVTVKIQKLQRSINFRNSGLTPILIDYPAGAAAGSYIASVSSYPAGAAAGSCFLLVSFFFLLLSSFFFFLLSSSGNTRFSHISLHPILTKLGHNDWYLDHYSGTNDGGVRGHHGVTGVKKVICTKKASSPSDYVALTRDLCICSSLTPSTKVMVLKNCQGSFGVTGVKSSFSQKRHQVLQIM